MSRPTLLGRAILRRSSLSLLAVGALLAGTLMIEHVLKSRSAVINLDSGLPTSKKLHLGLNAIGSENSILSKEGTELLPIPFLKDLPYRQQCVLGLLFLGGVGLVASIRPFDPERSILEPLAQPSGDLLD